jgi:hypothetical protein
VSSCYHSRTLSASKTEKYMPSNRQYGTLPYITQNQYALQTSFCSKDLQLSRDVVDIGVACTKPSSRGTFFTLQGVHSDSKIQTSMPVESLRGHGAAATGRPIVPQGMFVCFFVCRCTLCCLGPDCCLSGEMHGWHKWPESQPQGTAEAFSGQPQL